MAARHILVVGRHLGHIHEDVEKLLRKIVGPQNITVMAESFLLSAHLAEQSELILTAPSRLTGLLKTEKVRILKPPITLPGFAVKQYWPERFHEDPGNRWLRGVLSRMRGLGDEDGSRSEAHTSELQSPMRISYAVFCLKKKTGKTPKEQNIKYRHTRKH